MAQSGVTIRIRYGKPAECSVLEELQRRASLEWEDQRAALLAHPEAIRLPLSQLEDGRVRVAEIASQIVGFSVVIPKTSHILELDGLFVEPRLWGAGIGCALLNDAVRAAQRLGAHTVEAVAHPRAEGFYAKFGFTRTGDAHTQFGSASQMRFVIH